uniref:Oxidative stress 3 n=1 Tax=Oryza brachyantha TaxID=4533 RepID=J3LB23_ORYBR
MHMGGGREGNVDTCLCLPCLEIRIAPGMREACKPVSPGAPLCHGEACIEQANDRSEDDSFSGSSIGSACSSASDLSDDGSSYQPGDSPEPSSSSASSSTLQLDSEGPLYELSSLISQLPVRRGLSNYYQGKSQSFTSISDATCVQDLAKKVTYNKRMKACKSYAAGLDMNQRSNHLPRPCNRMIAKRPSKGSFACLLSRPSSASLMYSSAKPPTQQSKKDVQMHINS